MKQLNLFNDCTEPVKPVKTDAHRWSLFVDGASRNNPGRAGAGVYLKKDEQVVYQEGFYLGLKTNNEAEYFALLLGIFSAKSLLFPEDVLYIISDSELLVKQMKREYKVKNERLRQLYSLAFELLADINYSFCHVLRHYNKEADRLANDGIDRGTPVPPDFIVYLQSHGIAF